MQINMHRPLPPIDEARLRPAVRDRARRVELRRCQVCLAPTTGLRCPTHAGLAEAA